MRLKLFKLLPFIAFLVVLYALFVTHNNTQFSSKNDNINYSLPKITNDFAVPIIYSKGKTNGSFDEILDFDFIKNNSNKYTIIHFFASWCSLCIIEQQKIINYIAQNPNFKNNVTIYGIIWNDNHEKVNLYDTPYDVIAYDKEGDMSVSFGLNQLPANYLFDLQGRLVYKGEFDDKLIQLINNVRF